MAFLGHKKSDNTLIYVQLDERLFKDWDDNFITKIAHNVREACALIETGFEYVTGEYNDGGKIPQTEVIPTTLGVVEVGVKVHQKWPR
jgi:glycogen debranching enzyme